MFPFRAEVIYFAMCAVCPKKTRDRRGIVRFPSWNSAPRHQEQEPQFTRCPMADIVSHRRKGGTSRCGVTMGKKWLLVTVCKVTW